ncbi:hypothetical protein ACFE04_008088 [Oxalis oulophora]
MEFNIKIFVEGQGSYQLLSMSNNSKDVLVENSINLANSIAPISNSISSRDDESDYVSNSAMENLLSKSLESKEAYSIEDVSSDLAPKSEEIIEKSADIICI